jgi:hypothetical protein
MLRINLSVAIVRQFLGVIADTDHIPARTGGASACGKNISWHPGAATINRIVMEWHVQYRSAGIEHVAWHQNPEDAIEAACRLIDGGTEVFGLGTDSLDDTLDRREIARIYAIWARANHPFGRQLPESGTHKALKITLDK